MKKLITMSAMLVGLMSAAYAVEMPTITGSIGAETNNVYRGVSLSANKPSVNGAIGLGMKITDSVGAFVDLAGSSVNITDHKAFVQSQVGVKAKLGVTTVATGYRFTTFSAGTANATTSKDELFVKASTPLLTGTATGEYAKGARINGNADQYAKIGYSIPVPYVNGLTANTAVSYMKYTAAPTQRNNTEVGLGYAIAKNVGLYAVSSVGGKDSTGAKIANQQSFGVKYQF